MGLKARAGVRRRRQPYKYNLMIARLIKLLGTKMRRPFVSEHSVKQIEQIGFAIGSTDLGRIAVATTGRGIAAILFGADDAQLRADLEREFPEADLCASDHESKDALASVIALVEHPTRADVLPLDVRGTEFQKAVWSALREIKSGATASYSDVAETIGLPGAVRAVARACAANRLALAIPCHRVIAASGKLSGYRWGCRTQAGAPEPRGSLKSGDGALGAVPRAL